MIILDFPGIYNFLLIKWLDGFKKNIAIVKILLE